jgi:hypothetical protein
MNNISKHLKYILRIMPYSPLPDFSGFSNTFKLKYKTQICVLRVVLIPMLDIMTTLDLEK